MRQIRSPVLRTCDVRFWRRRESVNFERLLVPYSDTGVGVTHFVGIAIFSGETKARCDCHATQGEVQG